MNCMSVMSAAPLASLKLTWNVRASPIVPVPVFGSTGDTHCGAVLGTTTFTLSVVDASAKPPPDAVTELTNVPAFGAFTVMVMGGKLAPAARLSERLQAFPLQ